MKKRLLNWKIVPSAKESRAKPWKFCFLLFLATFLSTVLFAQSTVRGRVTSGDTALAGVTVQVKGTTTSTQTDDNGRFSISAPSNGTLVFTSIGFTAREVGINNRTTVDLTMQAAAGQQLNDVVVVGYGTQRRATVTGSVSTIKSDELLKTPSTTTSGALVGKIQGITTRQPDARPGAQTNIQVRNMGNPLYVIDGVPADAGQFNQLGVADVDNISILKDASAAIYGLRAANGVILVTTKKGRTGAKADINISGYTGYQNLTRLPHPPDAATYLRGLAWSNQNRGLPNPTDLTPETIAKWERGEPGFQSYDYHREILKPNVPQSYINASASGGGPSSRYYFSYSHTDQDALIKDFYFKRDNFQANLESGLAKGLKLSTQISGRIERRHQTGVPGLDDYFNPLLSIYSMWPTERPYANDNPNYVNRTHNINVNPATYEEKFTGYSQDEWRSIKPIFGIQYDLPFGLTAKATYSYTYTTQRLEEFEYTYDVYDYVPATGTTPEKYVAVPGNQNPWRRKRDQNISEQFMQFQLNYNKKIGDHTISAIAAAERQELKGDWFETGSLPQNNTVAIVYFTDQNRLDTRFYEEARAGYIGRVNYTYKNKYLLEGLGRYDGSYLYRPGSRYGFFPGVSIGWRPLEENFMKTGFGSKFSDLKIRASYGQTGSELGAAPFAFRPGYDYAQGTSVFNGSLVTGVRPRGLPTTTLTWVTNISKNIGIDFALFNNKLSGTFDVFERRRNGLPAPQYDVLLPAEAGYGFPNQNLESDAIRGVEGILTWSNSTKGGLLYSTSINGTIARLRSVSRYKPRFGNSYDEWRFSAEDRWANPTFGYRTIGQFQSQEEIDNYPINNDGQNNRTHLPGDLKFEDVNGDGIINGLDERVIGYGYSTDGANVVQPLLSFGFNNNFQFKGFSLQVDFSGASMQTYERRFEAQVPFQNNGAGIDYLINDAWRRSDAFNGNSPWIPGKYPAVRKDVNHISLSRRSDFWMTNISYVRLRNLELGYSLPKSLIQRFGVSNLRVYVHGTNLFSIDNMKEFGFDPEINANNGIVYPQQRIYTFGFNVNL
ncbi:MAG: TonB-dependent receptor plug [Segetibacter sp.]|nr:TonB-dependent receptor plug [Segetibacter sp.]